MDRGHRAPPGYTGEVPFGFGVVELPEGLRVITRLTESRPGKAPFGRRDAPPHHRRRHRRRDHLGVHRMSAVSRRGRRDPPVRAVRRPTATDMGVHAVRAALAEAGVERDGFQAAFCGTAYGGVAAGHKVLGAHRLHRHADRRRRSRLRERRRRAATRRGGDPRRAVRLRARVRHGEDAEGHHPLVVLRAVARGGRARGDAGVLRARGRSG